jgi:hypothetical protein
VDDVLPPVLELAAELELDGLELHAATTDRATAAVSAMAAGLRADASRGTLKRFIPNTFSFFRCELDWTAGCAATGGTFAPWWPTSAPASRSWGR